MYTYVCRLVYSSKSDCNCKYVKHECTYLYCILILGNEQMQTTVQTRICIIREVNSYYKSNVLPQRVVDYRTNLKESLIFRNLSLKLSINALDFHAKQLISKRQIHKWTNRKQFWFSHSFARQCTLASIDGVLVCS